MNMRARYCGPTTLSLSAAVGAYLRGGAIPDWPQFHNPHRFATHRCRTAMHAVLPVLGIAHGAEVLVPAYNCGSEIDAILSTGASVRLYDVGPDANISVEAIQARLTPATKAIYVIHYFGWPQDLEPVRRFCDQRGLVLLEDCALALFCRDDEGWLGRWGDASFFSMMKPFGVPDGGITLLRAGQQHAFPKSPIVPLAKKGYSLLKRSLARTVHASPFAALFGGKLAPGRPYRRAALMANGREPMPQAYHYDDDEMTGAGMSRLTYGVLNAVRPEAVVRVRRANYMRLLQGISDLRGVAPLFPTLPEGVCPLVLPLFVQDRDVWADQLSRLGADPIAWWAGYHPSVDFAECPNGRRFKDSVVALQIHQELNTQDMDFLIACVREVADGFRQPQPTTLAAALLKPASLKLENGERYEHS